MMYVLVIIIINIKVKDQIDFPHASGTLQACILERLSAANIDIVRCPLPRLVHLCVLN